LAVKITWGINFLPHKLEVREMLAYKFNMPTEAAPATTNQKHF